MQVNGIILLGLGPGSPDLLTQRAWSVLRQASCIALRTNTHPAVDEFPSVAKVISFDSLFAELPIADANTRIVDEVLRLGQQPGGVVYAVPGHPLSGDAVGRTLAHRAAEAGILLQVVGGVGFIDPALEANGAGMASFINILDAWDLLQFHAPPFPPDVPAIITQVYSADVARAIKPVLLSTYTGDHPVKFLHGNKLPEIESLRLDEIDRSTSLNLLSVLHIPAALPGTSFEGFQEIVAHLRAPDGCPWDREQTHLSLRSSLIEEAYEVLFALDAEDTHALTEELGDLLLQIVLHAQIAQERGEFRMGDVTQGIQSKLIRRHPHVFGNANVEGVSDVLQNWEKVKAAEHKATGKAENSALDSVPAALPALMQAEQYQHRAARLGFEWPELQGFWNKIEEELLEVRQAVTPEEQANEIGDLLFAIVNLARKYEIEAEAALRTANQRFRTRFHYIEKNARANDKSISDLSLDEMLELWQQAKKA